jgi:hypothetical protein
MEEEIICSACGWVGIESALLHPPKIGHSCCPKCESPDDLINGDEVEETMEKDPLWYLGDLTR